MQLRELAQLNGTLRENDGMRCNNCGATDHKSWLVCCFFYYPFSLRDDIKINNITIFKATFILRIKLSVIKMLQKYILLINYQ